MHSLRVKAFHWRRGPDCASLPKRIASGRPMPRYAPTTQLETHEVTNQPPAFVGHNLFDSDLALREAALREGGDWVAAPLSALGAVAGSEAVLELGELANQIGRAH